ncbi:MAG: PAS domain-containing protein [Aphanocapsa sp. GSE-SYN-MK-11-07L]|jgi:PAS domain S-box-containing protein|nr:PAS domain-containing protein [Aphanocapsa sp. GSE-SYN-MK-11-07L]
MTDRHPRSRIGKSARAQLRFYGVAVLSVAIALVITQLLFRWLYPTTTPFFFVAVMVSAWYGGWRAGLLATVLSTLAITYFFIQPLYSWQILNLQTAVRLSTFFAAAGVISLLNQSRRTALKTAKENLRAAQAAMEREQAALSEANAAKERQAFLLKLNDTLRPLIDAEEIQYQAACVLGEHLGASRVGYAEAQADDETIAVTRNYTNGVPGIEGRYRYDDYGKELLQEFKAGRTVVRSDIAHDPSLTAAEKAAHAALQLGATVDVPLLKAGRLVAVLFANYPVAHDWSAEEVSLIQEVVDRTWATVERARAETALRESEALLVTTFAGIEGAITVSEVLGDEFRFLSANRACVEWSGVPLQEWIGSRPQDILPPEQAQAVCERYRSAVRLGQVVRYEERLTLPIGEIWTYTAVTPLRDSDGRITRVVATSVDISDRKRAEADLQQKNAILNVISESTSTLIYAKDRAGKLLMVNASLLAAVGLTESEVLGRTSLEIHKPRQAAEQAMENDRVVMESGQTQVFEEVVSAPTGQRTLFSVKSPYRNEAGEVIGLIGISTDISDRVQFERDRERILQQEQAARKIAENANRLKDEFLAVVSHELRTPLNPILGWSKLLLRGNLDAAKTTNALTTIERNAQLQAQLIGDLLDISRILRGKLSLNQEPVDLGAVISSALETVRFAAEAKSLHVKTVLAQTGTVIGDAGRLQQLVWNLLSNAVKFTPPEGQITVALTQTDTQSQIQVTDTGKGIHPDFLPYVFEHFRQEDGATTRKFGGLGLGLAIARQIVEMHGGQISVDSAGEGQGATFTIQLPLAPDANERPSLETPSASTGDLHGLQILVIDDEIDSREIVTFVLQEAGAIVTSVSTGIEALQALEQSVPDLIVSDIGMPDMDGYMLLQQIRAQEQVKRVPAIALTAYAGEFDRQQALKAGFQKHLSKPIELSELITAIAALILQPVIIGSSTAVN